MVADRITALPMLARLPACPGYTLEVTAVDMDIRSTSTTDQRAGVVQVLLAATLIRLLDMYLRVHVIPFD